MEKQEKQQGQEKQQELQELHYDVFISYRHGELDGFIAEKLHKMLETYRVPASVAKKIGKKKLSRVFRDRDELPTSSNLSDSITNALKNSDFLLLICSKRTCQSQWVMREVETFGELHGKDKIITLLIDGEPDESFPDGLRERKIGNEIIFVEPLAADIRANTDGTPLSKTRNKDWDRSLKLLRTEEKLRLLAPILGCAYDNLRRRHRRRLIQKTVACASLIFALTFGFGAFSTYQYLQINKQMQLKLENESYVLAEYSASALSNGDRDEAIRLALEALPENLIKPERPFVTAAERALADALGIYDITDTFKPHKVAVLPVAPTKIIISSNDRYAAAVYPFSVAVIETASGRILHELPAVNSILADVRFLSDDIIVYSGVDGITAYDIARSTVLWQGESVTTISVSEDGLRIAAVSEDGDKAIVYSAEGEVIKEIDFGGRTMRSPVENFMNPDDRLFALDSSGGRLAVSFDDGSLSVFSVLDVSTSNEVVVYPPSNAGYFNGGFYKDYLFFSVIETEPLVFDFLLYDRELEYVASYTSDSRQIPVIGNDGLYLSNENMIVSVNLETGALNLVSYAGGRIESFAQYNKHVIISESGGDYSFREGMSSKARTYSSDSVNHFSALGQTYALTASRDSKTVRILKREHNSDNIFFSYDTDYSFSEVKTNSSQVILYSYTGFRLYDIDGTIIKTQEFPRPFEVLDTQYDEESGNLAIIYKDAFMLYSGTDGGLIAEVTNSENIVYAPFGVIVFDENNTLALYDWGGNISSSAILDLIYTENAYADEIIGIDKIDDETFAFAVSDGVSCKVFTAFGGGTDTVFTERFITEVRGRAEVYFTRNYVFISPMHGDTKIYNLDGAFIRTLEENAYMTEIIALGSSIAAGYVGADGARYSLILEGENLDTRLYIPGFTGETSTGLLLLNDGLGVLTTRELYSTEMLVGAARLAFEPAD